MKTEILCKHFLDGVGRCRRCGDAPPARLNGAWPVGTWAQRRRALLRLTEAERDLLEGGHKGFDLGPVER